MTVDTTGVSPTPGLYSGGTAAAAPKQALDKEVFLALLVAQLRNQDPTSPMDTTEMMAQSTQLASMEQLTSLTDVSRENFALQMRIAASGLVGQQVTYVAEDGTTTTGTATAVSFAGPVPMVTVNGVDIALDAISAVTRASSGTDATTGSDKTGSDTTGSTDSTDPKTTAPAGDPAA